MAELKCCVCQKVIYPASFDTIWLYFGRASKGVHPDQIKRDFVYCGAACVLLHMAKEVKEQLDAVQDINAELWHSRRPPESPSTQTRF